MFSPSRMMTRRRARSSTRSEAMMIFRFALRVADRAERCQFRRSLLSSRRSTPWPAVSQVQLLIYQVSYSAAHHARQPPGLAPAVSRRVLLHGDTAHAARRWRRCHEDGRFHDIGTQFHAAARTSFGGLRSYTAASGSHTHAAIICCRSNAFGRRHEP